MEFVNQFNNGSDRNDPKFLTTSNLKMDSLIQNNVLPNYLDANTAKTKLINTKTHIDLSSFD